MRRRLLILLTALSLLTLGFGQETKVPQGWTAKTIQWQSTSSDGTKWAILEGKSDAPGGAFTYAAFVPAGYADHHSHSSDARVAVVQGALKVGFGPNPTHLETYPVGSFCVFARQHRTHDAGRRRYYSDRNRHRSVGHSSSRSRRLPRSLGIKSIQEGDMRVPRA